VPDGRLHKFLCRFTDIRPDEAGPAMYLFIYFFLITFSIYIIKPVKENFLIGITPEWWPYADLITAGLIGFVVALNTKLLNRLPRRSYFSLAAVSFILMLIVFWCIFEIKTRGSVLNLPSTITLRIRKSWPAPVFVFSFWSDIFIVMCVTHFWLTVNDVFNPRQAKRTVSFFVTGGLLGGIAGSLLTSRLVHALGPTNLLLVCPGILLLTLILINHLYAGRKEIHKDSTMGSGEEKPSYLDSLRTIRGDRYLRILAGALASAIIVGSLINYQFKIAVNQRYPNSIARTSFLASFFLAILLISTIFHWVSTGQILKKFGIRLGLLIAPSVLFLGTLAVFLFPAAGLIIWACLIRGSDKTFDNTVSQSVRELLYIPIHPSIKYEAKIFIDMFVNKLAVGFGAAIFLILIRTPSFAHMEPTAQIRELGIFVIGFAIAGIILIWKIYAEYLSVVKKDLSRKWQDAHEVLAENVDIDRARLIADTLQSKEISSTLYAMNLFQLIQKEKLAPELKAFLSYRQDELKARSMNALFDVGSEAFYPGIEEVLADEETETLVREVLDLDVYALAMETQLSALIQNETSSEVERMEAAKLISFMKPTGVVLRCLHHLLQDTSPNVLNYALSSAAIHRSSEHVPLIIALLGNPMIRREAQNALASYGAGIEDILKLRLQDMSEHPEVRNAIPEIFAGIANQKAADILCMELSRGDEEMEQDLVESLYKIRSKNPNICFKKKPIENIALLLIRKIYAVYLAGIENHATTSSSASASKWDSVLEFKVKHIFDLLSLIYAFDDMVKAYQNILQGTHKSVDFSLELLDNILDRDIKLFLFPIIEDLPPEEKLHRLKKLVKGLDQRLGMGKSSIAGRVV
jgi:ATP:ADP antiporter, AAA family